MLGRFLLACLLACAFAFAMPCYESYAKPINVLETKETAAKKTRATEPLVPFQKDVFLPPVNKRKLWAKLAGFVTKKTFPRCDRRPQSPGLTGLSIQDTCGLNLNALYSKINQSVTQTVRPNNDGTVNWGTAFKYCKNPKECYFITNEHIVDDVKEIGLVTEDGENVAYGQVILVDKVNDLAIISAPPGDSRPSVNLGKVAKLQDKVFAVGHPMALPFQVVTVGFVTATNATVNSRGTVYNGVTKSTILVTSGSSGSPTFNEQGEVIGVISNKTMVGSVSVPVTKVLDLLAKTNPTRNAP